MNIQLIKHSSHHSSRSSHPQLSISLTSRRKSEALGSAGAAVLGGSSQTSLGKCLPKITLVGALGKSSVGIDDSISGLDHVGVARLTKNITVSRVLLSKTW
jgi:hypothetical protein